MDDQLNAIFFLVVQSGGGGVGICVVVVVQQAAGEVFGRRALQASKTLGREVLKYHSALTVFHSWSWTAAIGPDLVKKTAIIRFEVLHDLLNFIGGFLPGKKTD